MIVFGLRAPGRARIIWGLFIVALVFVVPVYSQDEAGTGDWIEIPGPQLERNEWERLRVMLSSPTSGDQYMALTSLEDSIRKGYTSAVDPNVAALLAQACLTPLQVQTAPGTGIQPDYPLHRIYALRLAGLLGGARAAAVLWSVVGQEIEPAALSEAWHSIRMIMRQPTEAQMIVLSRHLTDPFPHAPNDALMQELLLVVKAFHASWNCMARKDIFDPILEMSQNTRYLGATRSSARAIMKALMNLN